MTVDPFRIMEWCSQTIYSEHQWNRITRTELEVNLALSCCEFCKATECQCTTSMPEGDASSD